MYQTTRTTGLAGDGAVVLHPRTALRPTRAWLCDAVAPDDSAAEADPASVKRGKALGKFLLPLQVATLTLAAVVVETPPSRI